MAATAAIKTKIYKSSAREANSSRLSYPVKTINKMNAYHRQLM
jgi:hypothetical protein